MPNTFSDSIPNTFWNDRFAFVILKFVSTTTRESGMVAITFAENPFSFFIAVCVFAIRSLNIAAIRATIINIGARIKSLTVTVSALIKK